MYSTFEKNAAPLKGSSSIKLAIKLKAIISNKISLLCTYNTKTFKWINQSNMYTKSYYT